ncbi:MAG: hypothetical protein ACRDFX_09420 [Chloroflexota bacterium]
MGAQDVNPDDIQQDLEVMSKDGHRIGTVSEVVRPLKANSFAQAGEEGQEGVLDTSVKGTIDFEAGIDERTRGTEGVLDTPSRGSSADTSTGNFGGENAGRVVAGGYDTSGAASPGYLGDGSGPSPNRGHFVVSKGGFLGIGSTQLTIPFDAVDSIVPGARVTLHYDEARVTEMFGQKKGGTAQG